MGNPIQFGSWQKISDLGSGAFGVVSLWKNNDNDDFIAVKKCKFQTHINLTPKQKERWHNEVDIMKIINHPNVIKYKRIPPDLASALMRHNPTKLPLLPMEYCRKGNLRHVLCKSKNISGLEEQDVRFVLEDISSGLQYLHNLNITHRDIKPDNIVLQHCDYRKGNTVYKIIDLGYAKELGDTIVSFVGTLHYLAPEIFETIKYNSSVDYWSMGILTFEIICGVLPFLPHVSPVERFAKIKEKKPEEICMYLNYSGQVTNSSEIKKEHYISKCLQRHIENWLRHVLTFDPSRRSQNFPGDIKVFDYLSLILRKKIINVFSLHKLEFYSYEVNEGTLVGTLKQWISRDIKVQKDELILLIDKDALCMDIDNMLLTEIMKEETNVYVLCRNVLIADNVTYIFPKLIKEAMKSSLKFNMSYMRQLKAQMVYYISIEKTTANFFRTCFHLYLRYVNHSVEDVERKSLSLANEFSKLLTRVENYTRTQKNNICDIDLRNNIEYKDCVSYSQRLLASLERSFSNLKELKQRIRVMKRKKDLGEYNSEITKKIDPYDLQDQYAKALGIVENNNRTSDISDPKDVIKRITDLISETVRLKYIFLGNKEFRAYLSASGKVLIYTKTLLNWIQEFEGHLQKMSESFEKAEIIYRDIFLRAANVEKYREVTSKKDIRDRPTSYLIKENQDLRYKFEEILAKSIMAHKKYTQSMEI